MGVFGPEREARLDALASELRPLFAQEGGMEAIQQLLADREVGVMDSILVTRKLLGGGLGALGEAKDAVMGSPARAVERERNGRLVDELLDALDDVDPRGRS